MKEIPAVHSLLLEPFLSLFHFAKLSENIYGDRLDASFPFSPKFRPSPLHSGGMGPPKDRTFVPLPPPSQRQVITEGPPQPFLEPKPVAPAKRKAFSCLPAERAAHCSKYLPSIPNVSSLGPTLAFFLLGDARGSAPG